MISQSNARPSCRQSDSEALSGCSRHALWPPYRVGGDARLAAAKRRARGLRLRGSGVKGLANRSQQLDCLVPLVIDIVYEDGAFIRGLPRRSHLADAGTSAAKASIFDARSEGAFRQGPSMLGP